MSRPSSSRIRSDFWVAAYLRRVASKGSVAVLRRRGAAEAGAIFIKIDRLDGTANLLGPAPQSEADPDGDRRFTSAMGAEATSSPDVEARLQREIRFDSDLWIVEVEDRDGRSYLDEP